MTQEKALSILKTGGNVFLTGEPGSGKTHTLNAYTKYLRDHGIEVAITASTGIASTHIGGMTIHSWSGIGIRDSLSRYDLDQITSNERVVKRIGSAKVLVIDEISMLDARVLNMVDEVCRAVRRREEPFGGLQVLLVGDFFQLPPISRTGVPQFAFEGEAWKHLNPLICYLSEQYRQEDKELLSLLSALRRGEVFEDHIELLKEQTEITLSTEIEPTKLFTHNADVDRMNTEHLSALSGTQKVFSMESHGAKPLVESLKKSCLSPETLTLKKGALVMCTKNNFELGYVNGTLGRVVAFDPSEGYPVIETVSRKRLTISPMEWSISDGGKILAQIIQVPLRLAWAITVHKSQGMSLDAAEINLGNAFEYGQGYVALSRLRTFAGLKLSSFNARALEVHPRILSVDSEFREKSDQVSEVFEDMELSELKVMHERFIVVSGGTLHAVAKKTQVKRKVFGSTYETTLSLLKKKLSLETIVRERDMTLTTIMSHLEKLESLGKLAYPDIVHLLPHEAAANAAHREILHAIELVGDEKLKPIYEKTNGRYPYEDIRLVRVLKRVKSFVKR